MNLEIDAHELCLLLKKHFEHNSIYFNIHHSRLILEYFSQIDIPLNVYDLYQLCHPYPLNVFLNLVNISENLDRYEILAETRKLNKTVLIDFSNKVVVVVRLSFMEILKEYCHRKKTSQS